MPAQTRITVLGIILALLVVILIGVVVYRATNDSEDASQSQSSQTSEQTQSQQQADETNESDQDANSVPQDWQTYSDEDLGFRVAHPPQADVTETNETVRRIRLLGSENEPQTEITDGFLFTVITEQDVSQYSGVEEYAQAKQQEVETTDGTSIESPLEPIALSGKTAYVYEFETQLGTTAMNYVFLPENSENGYQVHISIQDPNDNNYRQITQQMLTSLELE